MGFLHYDVSEGCHGSHVKHKSSPCPKMKCLVKISCQNVPYRDRTKEVHLLAFYETCNHTTTTYYAFGCSPIERIYHSANISCSIKIYHSDDAFAHILHHVFKKNYLYRILIPNPSSAILAQIFLLVCYIPSM